MTFKLTPQQQAIVDHDEGPAVVFAVAGSGKTTAMVHRIERLIRQEIFTPKDILATSFNKAANDSVIDRLKTWEHCSGVEVRTLHALGFIILREANKRQKPTNMDLTTDVEQADRQILYETTRVARQKRVSFASNLEQLDQDDFLNFVRACKGNLQYANLKLAHLPASALQVASQAPAPVGMTWYLELYQLYEEVRRHEKRFTFDDMLMSGWEYLVRYPDILSWFQGRYRCVMVDEFQDVNLAQTEMLDLLTQSHRNYMVIGDDDQTIYEWRGANPDFILSFQQRYQAKRYFMTDNFRCQASHIALANQVIRHNINRTKKSLGLTKGFDGAVFIHTEKSADRIGHTIASEIEAYLQDGAQPAEIAVLVRIYAQTAFIEQCLIAKRIPYEVVGGQPFYARPEITTLLHYCRLGLLEKKLLAGQTLDRADAQSFTPAWSAIYNRPTRYLSKALSEEVRKLVVFENAPISRALDFLAANAPNSNVAQSMSALGDTLDWLANQAHRLPANKLLEALESKLHYNSYLRNSSGFPETGEGKVANVIAFIAYAEGKGKLPMLLEKLDQLASIQSHNNGRKREVIQIMTVFRAKGLEWPYVFVPDCNQGIIPFGNDISRLEEERRLLYVAVTRTKQNLHLLVQQDKPISQFLAEASHIRVIAGVETLKRALQHDPSQWSIQEYEVCAQWVHRLDLYDYLAVWWSTSDLTRRHRLAMAVGSFLAGLHKRKLLDMVQIPPSALENWSRLLDPIGPWNPASVRGLDGYIRQLEDKRQQKTAPSPPIYAKRTRQGSTRPRKHGQKHTTHSRAQSGGHAFRQGDFVKHKTLGYAWILHVEVRPDGEYVVLRLNDYKQITVPADPAIMSKH